MLVCYIETSTAYKLNPGMPSEVINGFTGPISHQHSNSFRFFEGIPFRRGYLLHGVPGRLVES